MTNQTILAWVRNEDIKAVRDLDGTEHLIVDGRRIPLTSDHVHPTQQVIGYCMAQTKRQKKAMRAAWAALEG